MKELMLRLRMPLNKFWAKTRLFLLSLSAISIALNEFIEPMLHNEFIPEQLHNWLRYIYVAGLFGSALASLTVHSTDELEHKKAISKL